VNFVCHDGGRAAAGYKGSTGDCVTRSIAIATGQPYLEVYDALNELGQNERIGKRKKRKSNSRPASTGRAIRDTSSRSAGSGDQPWPSEAAARFICEARNYRRDGSSSKCPGI